MTTQSGFKLIPNKKKTLKIKATVWRWNYSRVDLIEAGSRRAKSGKKGKKRLN